MTQHVAPAHTRPARLAQLAKLPIFLDLGGRAVVIAGGGEPVAWKAELLAAAGAAVTIYAEEPCAELLALVEAGSGAITVARRPWHAADLQHAWLAISDGSQADDAAAFAAAARSHGVLVNIIDQPHLCDFQFGTIVNRSPVVIGISTDGAAPILGQAIRRRIEAVLPPALGAWTRAAKEFRGRLKTTVTSRAARRRFWEKFVDITFISQTEEDARLCELERLAQEALAEPAETSGEVVIIGAGPGDPELITLKAMRELQAADVIVYDRLVSPGVLELGRREARRIRVGQQGPGANCGPEGTGALLVRLARAGERVVRLQGGDPALFGHTDEVEPCRAAGVATRIVPGVSLGQPSTG